MNVQASKLPALPASAITVLTAFESNTVKRFQIDEESGALTCIPYGKESHFQHDLYQVGNIAQLGSLVRHLSQTPNTILIRGTAIPGLPKPIRRRSENFPERPDGCRWVMLDFDDIPLPAEICPTSAEAIEYIVGKLPPEFHRVSYFYQFSSSAGIVKPDGVPLKSGLNAHVFFWLDRPVPGKTLVAYLERYCIRTGFYAKTRDRSEAPLIRLGIDPAVIRSSVQPHYVGLPIIGPGVTSSIVVAERQGLVRHPVNVVTLPEFEHDIVSMAYVEHQQLRTAYKRECGLVEARLVTRASHGGIAVSDYFRSPSGASPSTNRVFVKAEPYGEEGKSVILHFDEENSPGSWYLTKASPQLARRFGDGASLPLKELSDGAYVYVRDDLKWFTDVSQHDNLSLTEAGFLPNIQSFATARNALIEAPTGSGKTYAFCRFAMANPNKIILYAAQTRALVKQMYDDLTHAGIRAIHYKDFPKEASLGTAVYVTTNESLGKFIAAAVAQGMNYIFVVDEVHMALEDFMTTERKNQLFERAIGRSERSLFMTATITPLQITKLIDTVSRVQGALTPELYSGYRFEPVKSNPLIVQPVGELGANFIALLRRCVAFKVARQPIPRIVIIAPTSRMRVFVMALEKFGLLEDAHVVSRQESTPRAIEAARTSDKPILITSPMFALGLNFMVQPEIFWAYFSYLQVDTSQIIQTLNRANRGDVQCEVRLYHGELDSRPIWIPPAVQERVKIEGYLLDETSVQGVLDAHFHVDRPTFNALRKAEKNTAKSMGYLIEGDHIQNFRIEANWQETLTVDKTDAAVFSNIKNEARESYLDDIIEQSVRYQGEDTAMLLYKLELLDKEDKDLDRRTDDRVIRDLETEVRGIVMLLCEIEDPEKTVNVKPRRLRRLHGEMRPYLTAQYSSERTGAWRDAAAEKTKCLIPLLEALRQMKDAQMDGHKFAIAMRRPELRASVKALADSERDFMTWQRKLQKLDDLSDEYRNKSSAGRRAEIINERFDIAQEFLATIGVTFEDEKIDGRWQPDPTQPLVPEWDFEDMEYALLRNAKSLIKMPAQPVDACLVEERWTGPTVSQSLCSQCVHCKPHWICELGRPVQWVDDEAWAATDQCDAFSRIPLSLLRKKPTGNRNLVGSIPIEMPVAVDPLL